MPWPDTLLLRQLRTVCKKDSAHNERALRVQDLPPDRRELRHADIKNHTAHGGSLSLQDDWQPVR